MWNCNENAIAGEQNYSLLQFSIVMEYQRRTQKGIERKGKTPAVEAGIKTQRLAALAEGALIMVRFFCISVKMCFEQKSLTIQKK
jgi:hypothetical protein